MNRPIKFRAWVKEFKEMAILQEIDFVYKTCKPSKDAGYDFHFDDCEIMQFTGLHDKNGKEIYEGDIVMRASSLNGTFVEETTKFIVEWIAPSFYLVDKTMHLEAQAQTMYDDNLHEVIGNIFENPELVKEVSP